MYSAFVLGTCSVLTLWFAGGHTPGTAQEEQPLCRHDQQTAADWTAKLIGVCGLVSEWQCFVCTKLIICIQFVCHTVCTIIWAMWIVQYVFYQLATCYNALCCGIESDEVMLPYCGRQRLLKAGLCDYYHTTSQQQMVSALTQFNYTWRTLNLDTRYTVTQNRTNRTLHWNTLDSCAFRVVLEKVVV